MGLFPGFVLDVVLNGKVVEFEPSARGFEVSQSLDTVEPRCCGHLGDLVQCPVYSGTPLLWTPWGPGEMSCLQ